MCDPSIFKFEQKHAFEEDKKIEWKEVHIWILNSTTQVKEPKIQQHW